MKHYFSHLLVLLFVVSFLFCNGCGPHPPEGFPSVVPCKLVIQKNGAPLPAVTAMLVSEGGKEWFASGESDASGNLEIKTSMNNYSKPGAPEGTYKVTLIQIPQIKAEKTQQEIFDMPAAEKAAYKIKTDKMIKEARSFPLEFESYLTTPVSLEISKKESSYIIDVAKLLKR